MKRTLLCDEAGVASGVKDGDAAMKQAFLPVMLTLQ